MGDLHTRYWHRGHPKKPNKKKGRRCLPPTGHNYRKKERHERYTKINRKRKTEHREKSVCGEGFPFIFRIDLTKNFRTTDVQYSLVR